MGRHRLAAVAAFAVVAVECAGGLPAQSPDPAAAEVKAVTTAPADSITAAPPASAGAPAPAPAPAGQEPEPLPRMVSPVRPDVRIDDVSPDALRQISGIDGVRAAVMAGTITLEARGPEAPESLEALVVDVRRFRRFTPDVTANEVGVWERLDEGNVVLTSAAANRIGATLGEPATLSGPRASEALRVGALAANGLPQLADLLVTPEVGRRLGPAGRDTLLVAVGDDADPATVMEQLVAAVGGSPTLLEEPRVQQQAAPGTVGTTTLEAFSYQSFGDGTIRIDPGWVSRNIVSADVPILGRVTCHRVIIDQLAAALAEIQAAGLAGEIYQYAGCWVPRHMLWDPSRGISNHAWGLALDMNVPTNQYGAAPSMHPRIVETFRKWGFKWGGDFSTPDGMHFELERVVTP